MSPIFLSACAAVLLVCGAADGAHAAVVRADRWLVAGPRSVPPPLHPRPAQGLDFEEPDARRFAGLWPAPGARTSLAPPLRDRFEVKEAEGALGGEGTALAAVYLRLQRFAQVRVRIEGAGRLEAFLEGERLGRAGEPSATSATVDAQRSLRRGTYRLFVVIERQGTPVSLPALSIEGPDGAVEVGLDPRHPPARYEELLDVDTFSGLRVSPDGRFVAVRHNVRGEGEREAGGLLVLRIDDGATVLRDVPSSSARPLSFTKGGSLLVRSGDDLFLVDPKEGAVRRLLAKERGLADARFAEESGLLVVSTERGARRRSLDGIVRRTALREKLTDWPIEPHLELVDVETGGRRVLFRPGDYHQDRFFLRSGGRELVALLSVPIDERPWFATDVVIVDLRDGSEKRVRRIHMGFENRPGLLGADLSPDERLLAFVGPPSELGRFGGGQEPNAFDPDLHVVDLESGALRTVTEGFAPAVAGRPRFSADGRSIYFPATAGSRSVLARAELPERGEDGARLSTFEPGGERVHAVDFARDGRFAAVVSDSDRPPRLVAGVFGGEVRTLLDPDAELVDRLVLVAPIDASFESDGRTIEGWLYLPEGEGGAPPPGRRPWIVYYYGGATPTLRGYNELFQFLVANGYPLFVSNPRGAAGYGREFADLHVAEWGGRSGPDVLAGVEALLRRREDLDPARIGCFGGSYGGFLTQWLVSHSDRFAAAVSLYGISNLASYFGEGTWGWTYGDQAFGGKTPFSDPSFFVEHSPLFRADRIGTPLLLLHGDADVNVPPGESEQMFTALSLLGRTVEIVRFAGEDHGLRGTRRNRIRHREMLLDWFDRFLRDQPEAWRARFDGR